MSERKGLAVLVGFMLNRKLEDGCGGGLCCEGTVTAGSQDFQNHTGMHISSL
jgi:hypothetical protein